MENVENEIQGNYFNKLLDGINQIVIAMAGFHDRQISDHKEWQRKDTQALT